MSNRPFVPPTQNELVDFYTNPAIAALAPDSLWTISDWDKRPLDIRAAQQLGITRGAAAPSPQHLMTLAELVDFAPNTINQTFALSALTHQMIVLDIEKTCPLRLAREMIAILPWTYAEVSMSGQGYHLLLPLPDNLEDHPGALSRTKIREEHGWYELLIEHYVTFTRKQIPERPVSPGPTPQARAHWNRLFASLADGLTQVQHGAGTDVVTSADKPDIPLEDEIVSMACYSSYRKTPAAFGGDTSRWEYGCLSHAYRNVNSAVEFHLKNGYTTHSYDDEEITWLVYLVTTKTIPYRHKHDERRSGLPYLLYQASSIVARSTSDD